MITCSGAPTQSGTARRSGRLRGFAPSAIPEKTQKKYGFAPLAPADGTVKSAIFGYNAARFYKLDLRAELAPLKNDGIAALKAAYLEDGAMRSNAAYGFVARRAS